MLSECVVTMQVVNFKYLTRIQYLQSETYLHYESERGFLGRYGLFMLTGTALLQPVIVLSGYRTLAQLYENILDIKSTASHLIRILIVPEHNFC